MFGFIAAKSIVFTTIKTRKNHAAKYPFADITIGKPVLKISLWSQWNTFYHFLCSPFALFGDGNVYKHVFTDMYFRLCRKKQAGACIACLSFRGKSCAKSCFPRFAGLCLFLMWLYWKDWTRTTRSPEFLFPLGVFHYPLSPLTGGLWPHWGGKVGDSVLLKYLQYLPGEGARLQLVQTRQWKS